MTRLEKLNELAKKKGIHKVKNLNKGTYIILDTVEDSIDFMCNSAVMRARHEGFKYDEVVDILNAMDDVEVTEEKIEKVKEMIGEMNELIED